VGAPRSSPGYSPMSAESTFADPSMLSSPRSGLRQLTYRRNSSRGPEGARGATADWRCRRGGCRMQLKVSRNGNPYVPPRQLASNAAGVLLCAAPAFPGVPGPTIVPTALYSHNVSGPVGINHPWQPSILVPKEELTTNLSPPPHRQLVSDYISKRLVRREACPPAPPPGGYKENRTQESGAFE